MVVRHRHVTALYLEDELGVCDRLLVALDEFIGKPVDQRLTNVWIGADSLQSRGYELMDHHDDIAHEAHADVLPFRTLLLHAGSQERGIEGAQLKSSVACEDLLNSINDTFTLWELHACLRVENFDELGHIFFLATFEDLSRSGCLVVGSVAVLCLERECLTVLRHLVGERLHASHDCWSQSHSNIVFERIVGTVGGVQCKGDESLETDRDSRQVIHLLELVVAFRSQVAQLLAAGIQPTSDLDFHLAQKSAQCLLAAAGWITYLGEDPLH